MNRMEAPEGSSGSGAHDFGSPLPSSNVNEQQVSLLESFALTTCVTFGIGVFLYFSSLLALLVGGGLIVAAVLRFCGCRNLLKGGFVGFVTAAALTFLIVQVGDLDGSISIGQEILCPSAGYVFGALAAELQDDSI